MINKIIWSSVQETDCAQDIVVDKCSGEDLEAVEAECSPIENDFQECEIDRQG